MKILYFAPVYYDDMKQRPQQIAQCLAKKHDVYYIEPTISSLRWLLKGGRTFWGRHKRAGKRLWVIRLNGSLTLHKSMEIFDICGVNNWSELRQLSSLIAACDVVWVGYAGWYTLVRHIKHKCIVFDKMDEEDLLASSIFLKMTLRRGKRRLTKLADILFVTCRLFYEQLNEKREEVYWIPNAVSGSFASVAVSFEAPAQVKRFGYIGTISTWFDTAVIEKLLKLHPQYEVFLVGRNYLKPMASKRVHYLGVRKNSELAALIQSFDICLYNFTQTPLLDTVNPVKIYEYLSLNKPVLAVKSKETCQLEQYLMLYSSVDELAGLIQKVKLPFSCTKQHRRFLEENCWESRVRAMEQVLERKIQADSERK